MTLSAVVADFYRRHDLAPLFQVPLGPETRSLDADLEPTGLGDIQRLAGCWSPIWQVALTRCPPRPDLPAATFEPTPSAQWLAGYLYRGTPLPESAVAVLRNADPVVFGPWPMTRGQAAVVRGVVTQGWLGVTALTVAGTGNAPASGRHLMGELLRWAASRGAGGRVPAGRGGEPAPRWACTTAWVSSGITSYHYRRPDGR